MKDADRRARLRDKPEDQKPRLTTGQTGKHEGDARGREETELPKNREKLRVNEEHKTPEMERNERGTFP